MEGITDEQINRIKELADRATDLDLRFNRYDHGGGRMFSEQGNKRQLIIDAYNERDREFYFFALPSVQALLAEVKRLKADNDKAWTEVIKLRILVEGDQSQPWER